MTLPFSIFGLGGPEIALIALVLLLLFGGKKIPELMKGLGRGVKNFKDGMTIRDDADTSSKDATTDDKSTKD
jgi:sec-independent protein translocase protein TatA